MLSLGSKPGNHRTRGFLLSIAVAMLGMWIQVASAVATELLMFDSANCSWCRRWDREVGVAYPNSEEGQRAPLRRVDISKAGTIASRLARPVTATPTFVLIADGAEIGRITGYPGADFFWGQLAEMMAPLSGPAAPPLVERERSAALPKY